jgi:hypothetical protein
VVDNVSPSVCILTACNSLYRNVALISVPRMRQLADAHGYELRVVERDDCARRGGWIKIQPIVDALGGAFDFVLWLDADTLVTRVDTDLRNVMHPNVHLHLAWHTPVARPGGDSPHFNTGVMLIRASDWSRGLFKRVWDIGPLEHRWNDQATIHHMLGYDEIVGLGQNRRSEIDRSPISRLNVTWNSIPDVCALADPVIWHFAGMQMERRRYLMRAFSSR